MGLIQYDWGPCVNDKFRHRDDTDTEKTPCEDGNYSGTSIGTTRSWERDLEQILPW